MVSASIAAAGVQALEECAAALLLVGGAMKLATIVHSLGEEKVKRHSWRKIRPGKGAQAWQVVIAGVELSVAVAVTFDAAWVWAAVLLTLLGWLFVGIQIIARQRGAAEPCACFGAGAMSAHAPSGAVARAGAVCFGGAVGLAGSAAELPLRSGLDVGATTAGTAIAFGLILLTGSTPCHRRLWSPRRERLSMLRRHPIYAQLATAYRVDESRFVHARTKCVDEFRFRAKSTNATVVFRVAVTDHAGGTVHGSVRRSADAG